MRARDTILAVVALGTRLSLDSLWPLRAGRAGGTGVSLVVLRTGRAGVALRPLGTRVTGVVLGTLRPGVTLVAFGAVEVASLGGSDERKPSLVSQFRRGVGRVGRNLLRVLVRVDGADEQRKAVLFLLFAVDQHRFHADREHARAHVAIVPKREHHLRVHDTGSPAHGCGIVDDKRPLGGVHLLEGHGPALLPDTRCLHTR